MPSIALYRFNFFASGFEASCSLLYLYKVLQEIIPPLIKTELIQTILVYKFPQYSRQEIAAMLGMSDFIAELKQTRVYRDAIEEGREVGREEGSQQATRSLILRQLNHQLRELPAELQIQIEQLPLPQLENLGEALLDFQSRNDLENWLSQHQ
jgi:predicted transposase YdaD